MLERQPLLKIKKHRESKLSFNFRLRVTMHGVSHDYIRAKSSNLFLCSKTMAEN